MFEALLGRKFTAKCKHAIKCIYERLKPIRNRKQAVVNILKKDIADLLRNGNDSHAFGRMDGLKSEMNRLACYDMIQKYCECVLVQLPLLQKRRECPPEHMEAVSTLIFAAARFSDLPELCDLRHVFTTRYGSSMDTSVNPEFKDKSASKASPVAKRLQLMKDIACEFSVNWDSESFQYRITNPTASEHDQTKKGNSLKDRKATPASEKDGMLKCVLPEAKDIHVISDGPEPTRKTKKVWAEVLENVTPSPVDSSFPHVKPEINKDDYRTEDRQRTNETDPSSRTREVLDPINQGGKVAEQLKPMDDRRVRSKVPRELNGTGSEGWDACAGVYKRTSRAQVGLNASVEDDNVMEQLKSKDEAKTTNVVPPFVQREYGGTDAKESQDTVYKRSSRPKMDHKGERSQVVGQREFEDSYKPTKAPQSAKPKDIEDVIVSDGRAKDDFFHERSAKPRQDADFAAPEGRVARPQKPNNERAFHTIPPPYVKQAVRVGANGELAKTSTQPTYDCGFAASDKSNNGGFNDMPKDELVVDDEMPKPRSVRRKQHKPPMIQEDDGAVHGDEHLSRVPHGQRRRSSRRKNVDPRDDDEEEEMVMDRLLIHYSKKGMVDQSSMHRTRTQALPADHALHDGEAGRYQQNGRSQAHEAEAAVQATHADHTVDRGEVREHRTYERRYRTHKAAESRQALPSDHVVQDGEAVLQGYGRQRARRPESMHPPERVVSLPPEAVSPKDMVKGAPARATSMHAESPSPPGGRMHPRLPDYDELATRFAALKRG